MGNRLMVAHRKYCFDRYGSEKSGCKAKRLGIGNVVTATPNLQSQLFGLTKEILEIQRSR
jgi:hypothetical protein